MNLVRLGHFHTPPRLKALVVEDTCETALVVSAFEPPTPDPAKVETEEASNEDR